MSVSCGMGSVRAQDSVGGVLGSAFPRCCRPPQVPGKGQPHSQGGDGGPHAAPLPPARPVPGADPPAPSCALLHQHTRPLTPRAQSHHSSRTPGEPGAPRTCRVPHRAPRALRIHHEPCGRAKNPTSTSRTPQECHMPHGYVICPTAVSHPTDRSQSAHLHLVPHSSATHPTGPSCVPQTSHVPHRRPTDTPQGRRIPTALSCTLQRCHVPHSSTMHPTDVPCTPQLHHASQGSSVPHRHITCCPTPHGGVTHPTAA